MSKISYFKSLKSRVPEPAAKELEYYLQRIKDGKNEKLITQLRLEVDPNKKKEIKNNLPAVTFCGQFTLRNKDNFKQGSGFAILDFDKLENVVQQKELLKANDYVFAAWISPSGNGLKALVKIPIISNDTEYKHIFKQYSNYFQQLTLVVRILLDYVLKAMTPIFILITKVKNLYQFMKVSRRK